MIFSLVFFFAILPSFALEAKWEQIDDDEGIIVFQAEFEDNPIVAFRGEMVMSASVAKLVAALQDTKRQKEWIDDTEEAEDIEILSKTESIEYNRTGTPFIIQDRDFVFKNEVIFDHALKQVRIHIHSVTHPKRPPREGIVRGELIDSSYVLTYLEPKKTKVSVSIFADPKGSVPKWVVNLFQKSWPRKTLEGLSAQVAKLDVPENPDCIGIFEANGHKP